MDTYSMHIGDFSPAVVLGKPPDLGGVAAPINLAAIGAELCIRKASERVGLDVRGAKVAIQGFGKVGMNVTRLLARAGAKIVGIADVSGAYVNERGIDVDEVSWHQESHGILYGLEGETDVQKLDNPQALFHLPVDILVLAAIELQITEENVEGVRARVVAEIAHDPVSPKADQALYKRGTLVLPDILCGGGGIAGAYLEWVQNRMGYYWPAERMQEEVREIVGRAFENAMEIARSEALPLRLAAAVLAVRRLAAAATLRGVYA
jgi:glutamate dehydrogenase/leucine dehydrogenase